MSFINTDPQPLVTFHAQKKHKCRLGAQVSRNSEAASAIDTNCKKNVIYIHNVIAFDFKRMWKFS